MTAPTSNLLIRGVPKAGKTTVISRLVELLREHSVSAAGFLTRELRGEGRRVGFAVHTLDGNEAVIAHQDLETGIQVGRFGVDVPAFERVALPVMERLLTSDAIAIIDEIARMELASPGFVKLLGPVLERSHPLVATIHAQSHPVTDAILQRPGVQVIEVTEANRDELPARLAARLTAS